jgi:glycosyltransferase involved in cell wall biosynthesis
VSPLRGETLALKRTLLRAGLEGRFDFVEFPEYGGWARAAHGLDCVRRIYVRLHGSSKLFRAYTADQEIIGMKPIDYLESWCTKHAHAVSSPSLNNWLDTEKSWGCSIPNVSVVPNPIEPVLPGCGGAPRSKMTVLFAGRLERRKGAHILARAIPDVIKRIPDVRFRFFGKDCQWPDGRSGESVVRDLLQEQGVGEPHVRLLGVCERDQILEEIRRATVMVVPSLCENCPMVVLEAMSCSTPLIVSDTAAFRELVRPERDGLSFEVGNSEALATQLIRVLESEQLRQSLGMSAGLRSAEFETPTIVDQLLEFWSNGLSDDATIRRRIAN